MQYPLIEIGPWNLFPLAFKANKKIAIKQDLRQFCIKEGNFVKCKLLYFLEESREKRQIAHR